MNWPGTISLRNDTSKAVLRDVFMTSIRHVFKKIVVLDGCGADFVAIDPLIHEIAFERAIGMRIFEQYWSGNT